MARVDREGQEQAAFFTWLRMVHPDVWELAYHVPNGGSRGKDKRTAQIEGGKLKRQGVKAGVPDICIPIAKAGAFGLYIEFKATPPHDAEVQTSQKAWLKNLTQQGYRAVLRKGLDELKKEVEWYLSQPDTQVAQSG